MRIPANWPWVILASFLLLPWLALLTLGGFWLWQNHYLAMGLLALASFYGILWLLSKYLKNRQVPPFDLPGVLPDERWSPTAEAVWSKLDKMAEELNPADYPLTDSGRLLHLARQVIGEVARHYYPKAGQAELDVPLRNILFIAEQVCRDMRQTLDEKIPLSHLLTLDDGLQLWKWKDKLKTGHMAYRLSTMLFSPTTAIPRELSSFFLGKASTYPIGFLERWLLQTLVKKIGYYAIALYSGQLAPPRLSEPEPEIDNTTAIKKPLRILIAGQVKAGKSSLVNALFGDLRAPTDVLPLTDALTIYSLKQADMGEVLIFDSPGYGDESHWFKKDPQQALGGFDLVLIVCCATQAGREADAQFLNELRNWFDERLERRLPPILAVVTHIDQLRPMREWQPPYDVQTPQDEKARNIRGALEDVAETLHIALEDSLPVSLQSRGEYNIDAVWTAMAEKLPESLRAQYLRCLPEGKDKEKWAMIRTQLANTGRFLVSGLKKLSS
ncbi:MAG: 50S ribosome-binding GTPase [Methylobacter sp.]|nr:50S ribosome-binding GTPase [Methylobacter sp.]